MSAIARSSRTGLVLQAALAAALGWGFSARAESPSGESAPAPHALRPVPMDRGFRISWLSLTPSRAQRGAKITGRVSLSRSAPAGGATVSLTGHGVAVPSTVVVPQRQSWAEFTFAADANPGRVGVTATFNHAARSAFLYILPPPPPPPAQLSSLTISSPNPLIGGQSLRGEVTLSRPAPASGVGVALRISYDAGTAFPQTQWVVVGPGRSAAEWSVPTPRVNAERKGTLIAALNNAQKRIDFSVVPSPVLRPRLTALTVSPASVSPGGAAEGEVTLSVPASGETSVSIIGDPALHLPSSVLVKSGESRAAFRIQVPETFPAKPTLIAAALNGDNKSASLAIVSRPQRVSAVSVAPASVVGGASVQGTVTLERPADADTNVALTASGATAPSSVVVKAGAQAAAFILQTAPVPSPQVASVIAAILGSSARATFSVTPAPVTYAAVIQNPIGGSAQWLKIRVYTGGLKDATFMVTDPSGLLYPHSYNFLYPQRPDPDPQGDPHYGLLQFAAGVTDNGGSRSLTVRGHWFDDRGNEHWLSQPIELSFSIAPLIQSVALNNPNPVGFGADPLFYTVNFAAPVQGPIDHQWQLVLTPGSDGPDAVIWDHVGSMGQPSGRAVIIRDGDRSAQVPLTTRLVHQDTAIHPRIFINGNLERGNEWYSNVPALTVRPMLANLAVVSQAVAPGNPLSISIHGLNATPQGRRDNQGPLQIRLSSNVPGDGIKYPWVGQNCYLNNGCSYIDPTVGSVQLNTDPNVKPGSYELRAVVVNGDWSQEISRPFSIVAPPTAASAAPSAASAQAPQTK